MRSSPQAGILLGPLLSDHREGWPLSGGPYSWMSLEGTDQALIQLLFWKQGKRSPFPYLILCIPSVLWRGLGQGGWSRKGAAWLPDPMGYQALSPSP